MIAVRSSRGRRGAVLVVVLISLLVLGMLATTMLTRAQATRRHVEVVSLHLQRQLALDSAIVHGFHVLKNLDVERAQDLTSLPRSSGDGEIAGIPYRFTLTPDPETRSVRIAGFAGKKGRRGLEAAAVAVVRRTERRGGGVEQRWTLRTLGPEPPAGGPH
jgi:hypothetical protein